MRLPSLPLRRLTSYCRSGRRSLIPCLISRLDSRAPRESSRLRPRSTVVPLAALRRIVAVRSTQARGRPDGLRVSRRRLGVVPETCEYRCGGSFVASFVGSPVGSLV
jgi:hypothetical protein